VAELGSTLGEELLRPTRIYVPQVRALADAGIRPRAMAHITGDGLLNLRRVEAPVGFRIDWLPEPPRVFALIERFGEVPRGQMRTVFNMGVGFTVVVGESEAERALAVLRATGVEAWRLGRAVDDPERRVRVPAERLVGRSKHFDTGGD
jgi:phosphoribosylformylglycinamidine cyclo-ligase